MGLVMVQVEAGLEDLDSRGQYSKTRLALQNCGRGRRSLSQNAQRGGHTAQGRENSWHFRGVEPVQGRSMTGVRGPLGTRGPQQTLQVGLEGPLGRTEGLGFTNENKP